MPDATIATPPMLVTVDELAEIVTDNLYPVSPHTMRGPSWPLDRFPVNGRSCRKTEYGVALAVAKIKDPDVRDEGLARIRLRFGGEFADAVAQLLPTMMGIAAEVAGPGRGSRATAA